MTYGLIIVKKNSRRLANKNWIDFGENWQGGPKPMFQWNLEKCLKIFKKVYVNSDYDYILEVAANLGAIPIKRPLPLCGNKIPNIPIYQYSLEQMKPEPDIIVAIQANSPTIKTHLIKEAKYLMEERGFNELMTCDRNYNIYGSIWAITSYKLKHYEEYGADPYNPKPEILLLDPSVDIHNQYDLTRAKEVKHL